MYIDWNTPNLRHPCNVREKTEALPIRGEAWVAGRTDIEIAFKAELYCCHSTCQSLSYSTALSLSAYPPSELSPALPGPPPLLSAGLSHSDQPFPKCVPDHPA